MLLGQMSIWGHLGSQESKGHFHQKMLLLLQNTWYYLLYVTYCIYVAYTYALTLRPSIVFMGPRSTWGHFRRQGTPAVPAILSSIPSALYFSAVKRLLEMYPKGINQQKQDLWTPLHLAAYNNKIEVLKILLSHVSLFL